MKYIFSILLSSFIFITFLKFKCNSKFRKFYSKIFLSKLYVFEQFRSETFWNFYFFGFIGVPFEDVLLTGHKNIHILKNIHFLWLNVHIDFHIETTMDTTLIMPLTNPMNKSFYSKTARSRRTSPTTRTGPTEIKRIIWIYNCITCYSEICTAVKITARRTWWLSK